MASTDADIRKQAYDDLQALNSRLTRLTLSVRRRSLDSETDERKSNYEVAFSAAQRQLERLRKLDASVAQLELEVAELAKLAARRAELDDRLTIMYESVFYGPSENADEDRVRREVNALKKKADEVSCLLEHDTAGRL